MVLVHPSYFSPIVQYVAMIRADKVIFEVEDHFQKQTYRNRCVLYSARGKQVLSIPIQHGSGSKQKATTVRIDYKDHWEVQHLRTLKTAYNASPFFEFYQDELSELYQKKQPFLIDFLFDCHEFVMEALQVTIPYTRTREYQSQTEATDHRSLVIAKSEKQYDLKRYIQVFEQSHGFIPNLSILDLLFMEGPNALNYLEQQVVEL
ncbi:MAG: WbqC family protein [Lutibacter sp.]|jgi:hypothetical protein|nr:WbqC family protein [Lutibacter sp.]